MSATAKHTTPAPETGQSISVGEKQYNWLVYTGLNYWANLAASLVTADYFTHGSGKKHLSSVIAATERLLMKPNFMKAATAHSTSKGIWETLALTLGGIMATLATKPVEDHKRSIVHWLNEKHGVDQTAPDGHKMTPDEIYIEKEQPHQTWLQLIMRRVLASFVIVGTGIALENTVGQTNIKNGVVGTVNDGLKSGMVPGGHAIANNATFQRYLGYASLDTIFTAVHATMMKLTNGARRAHMTHEIDHTADPVGVEKNHQIVTEQTPPRRWEKTMRPNADRVAPERFAKNDILPMTSFVDKVTSSQSIHSLAS